MADTSPEPFRYDAEVEPGERRHVRYEIGETYLGDPVEIPVTIINGEHAGPTVFLTAALHGDELNGVKVLQEVADRYEPAALHGTLVSRSHRLGDSRGDRRRDRSRRIRRLSDARGAVDGRRRASGVTDPRFRPQRLTLPVYRSRLERSSSSTESIDQFSRRESGLRRPGFSNKMIACRPIARCYCVSPRLAIGDDPAMIALAARIAAARTTKSPLGE